MNKLLNEEITKVIVGGSFKEIWQLYLSLRIQYSSLMSSNNIKLVETGVNIKFDLRKYLYNIGMYEDLKNETWTLGNNTWSWYDVKKELEDRESILRHELMRLNMVESQLEIGGFEQ